ncbi:MAG: glycosyltransferase [Candidatus Limnocylindrus sp.]
MAPRRILVIEFPRPSTRTVRFMKSFRELGVEVAYLDHPMSPQHPELADCRRVIVPKASILDRLRARVNVYPRHQPPVPHIERKGRGLPSTKRWWYRATAAIAKERPDLYWVADLDALPVATWARAARARACQAVPIVFDMHELWADQGGLPEEQVPTWREISRRFIPTVDRLVTVSQEFIDEVRREHPRVRTELILSLAPDVEHLTTEGAHAALGIPPDAPIAVHVGATVENRNPYLGIRALQHLPRHHLVFDGTADEQVLLRLRELATSLGVERRVHVTNTTPRARLEALLSDCQANLVLYGPSTSTKNQMLVLPNKVFDGLAAGLPTVAAEGTATGAYLTREGLGTTFVADDPASLAAAIERSQSAELLAAVKARRSEFHWSSNQQKIAELLESLLPDNPTIDRT